MINADFATKLLAEFGSPLYVYDADEIACRAGALRAALPEDAFLLYSLKANPLPAVGRLLHQQGYGAEISSSGELDAALAAGFAPDKILYTGPAKTTGEIRAALAANVTLFSCESWSDLDRLAAEVDRPVRVLLRVNPPAPPQAQLAMSGVASQFGFEPGDLVVERLRLLPPTLRIAGIHIYYGSQIATVAALSAAMEMALRTAESLAQSLDLPLQILDIGGGFPAPYAVTGAEVDLTPLRDHVLRFRQQGPRTSGAALWFESGRYLSASSGALLSTVMAVKAGKGGRTFVVLDAGINCLGGMAGLGRIFRHLVQIIPLRPPADAEEKTVDIVGPLCSPLDYLARDVKTPPLAPGDVVAIPNVGAYGLTASLVHFLSRPAPVEVVYRGHQVLDSYQIQARHKRISMDESAVGS